MILGVPWFVLVMVSVAVVMLITMAVVEIKYRLHGRREQKMMEKVDTLLNDSHERLNKIGKTLREKECEENASTNN